MITAWARAMAVLAVALTIGAQPSLGQLFESDSKRFGNTKMDIVIREDERRPRASLLSIDIKVIGSSVGSSFFILCSIRALAQLRGGHRYIVKIDDHPKRGQMLVGFLTAQEESVDKLGEEFRALKSPADVIDLEQFAPICDRMKS